jgi:hypothetical protein
MTFKQTGDFKLPYFERTSPSRRARVRHLRDLLFQIDDLLPSALSESVVLQIVDLPWLIETLQELAAQKITVLVAGYGGGGGQQTIPPRTCEAVRVETTLGELAKGIPITVGKTHSHCYSRSCLRGSSATDHETVEKDSTLFNPKGCECICPRCLGERVKELDDK